jgi:hypothetical protein
MPRSIPWFWILVAGLLLLAPSQAARLIMNLVGGLTIIAIIIPLALVLAGLVGWQVLRAQLRPCPSCGFRSLGLEVCPACGVAMSVKAADPIAPPRQEVDEPQASRMTVDVDVVSEDLKRD